MASAQVEILIVEDSEAKLDSIRTVLTRAFPAANLKVALSVKAAIDELNSALPDIIVADMSLPTYDIEDRERGGTPRPFGGIEVFEHLDRYGFEIPVLVVTSYPALSDGKQSMGIKELSRHLFEDFQNCFVGTVYFDSAYSTWEREIVDFLSPIVRKINATGRTTS